MTNDGGLWVSISSWRLRPVPADAYADYDDAPIDLYQRYIDEALPRIATHLQDKGLISSWAVRTGDDQFTYIGVYTSKAAMDEMWALSRQSDELRELFDTYLDGIRHEAGPMTDVFHIGSRWQFIDPNADD